MKYQRQSQSPIIRRCRIAVAEAFRQPGAKVRPRIRLRLLAPLLTACLLFWPGLRSAQADALADFSGGLGEGQPNQFPGSAGQGWIDGWNTFLSAGIEGDFAFETGSDPEFGDGIDVLKIARQGDRGFARISRILDTAETDPAAPHTVSFKFRADEFAGTEDHDFRVTVISASQDDPSPSPGSAVWCIVGGELGEWSVYHGDESGGMASTRTRVLFEPGRVYSVKVIVSPPERTFRVEIESDAGYYESPEFGFANPDAAVLPEFYSFGGWVSDEGTGSFRWSLGPLKIENFEQ